jgi:hypothetical protein
VVGEAFPTYFTFLHGGLLARLLAGSDMPHEAFAFAPPDIGPRKRATGKHISTHAA